MFTTTACRIHRQSIRVTMADSFRPKSATLLATCTIVGCLSFKLVGCRSSYGSLSQRFVQRRLH